MDDSNLTIRKVWRAGGAMNQEYGGGSAVWEIREAAGLWIRKAKGGWKVYSTGRGTLPNQIVRQLDGQKFSTRRETLQAIQAVLLSQKV